MRQRITYLLPEGIGIDPSDIEVGEFDLTFAKTHSTAEERRITLGLSELPQEVRAFLEGFHELHVRIVSHQNHKTFSPAVSRLPAGLHAFFTPRTPKTETALCPTLKYILGDDVKCDSSSESFSKPPVLSERFASSSTYQFYHSAYDLSSISHTLKQQDLCRKTAAGSAARSVCDYLSSAPNAASIDYDFDAISHAVTITILSTPPKRAAEPPSALRKLDIEDRLEVGILQPDNADEPEELRLGGYLTVVGEDDHPGATLFSFPARHHPLPATDKSTFSVNFQNPTGLHPKLDITLPAATLQPPKPSCALHAYLTLPSSLFIDRYQLSDPLFLSAHNLIALRALSGEQDLEAPDWAIHRWGSAALLELAHPTTSTTAANWTITLPTHLRYINATSSTGREASVSIPWPVLFWACEAEEGLKMATNPFDRVNLGYDGLFGPKTMFYHVPPAEGVDVLVERLGVPTLNAERMGWVSVGTVVAVLVGFGWVCWGLFGGGRKVEGKEKGRKGR